MEIGIFLMPAHPPERTLYDATRWDLDVIELADQLGYVEAWVGEHFTVPWEPICAPICCWRRRCCAPNTSSSPRVRTCCPTIIRSSWPTGWPISTTSPRVGSCSAWRQRHPG